MSIYFLDTHFAFVFCISCNLLCSAGRTPAAAAVIVPDGEAPDGEAPNPVPTPAPVRVTASKHKGTGTRD